MKKDLVLGVTALIIIIVCGVLYYNFSVLDEKPASEVPVSEPLDFQNVLTINMLKVYVTGEVISPGVYELEENSRIEDAIIIAGGETENADLSIINLARFINDGEHIIIPAFGDPSPELGQTGRININTATKSELMTLPNIGEVTAESIISYREKHGRFAEKEDIKNVQRIGDRIFESIEDLITVR